MNAVTNSPRRKPLTAEWLRQLGPHATCLRPYQSKQIASTAEAVEAGRRRILLQLPTGGGKTHEIAALAEAAVLVSLRVLIVATRTRLVRQISERLTEFEVPHGIIAAAIDGNSNFTAPVQVASADTLHRRAMVTRVMPMPLADVTVFDEAHLATAETRLGILDSYPDALRIGFTATPARKGGQGLARAFDALILGPSIRELQRIGMLVPMRIFSTPLMTAAELKAVPRDSANDYATEALGELLSRPKLVGDVVENWCRIATGKRTIIFGVHKSHGASLVTDFLKHGVSAELLTDQDDEDVREAAIGRLEAGTTRVLVNCFLLSYGLDVPSVECIVLARPTRSLPMYLQMTGRGLRPNEGKADCILIDHGRVVETLGLPYSDFPWSLDEGHNVNVEARKAQTRRVTQEATRTCRECSSIWLTSECGSTCPECGWRPTPKAKTVEASGADLEEMADRANAVSVYDAVAIQFYRETLGWFAQRKPNDWRDRQRSIRWAAWMRTVERFKLTEPRPPGQFWECDPLAPSTENAGWLLSRQIRWARSKSRSAA